MTEQENINIPYLQISALEQNEQTSMIVDKLNELITHINALENLGAELLTRIAHLEDDEHDHWHDEYASVDYVEHSESSFNSQLSNIKNDISNLEYRVNDAERKAERAQSTADEARRSARGGW